MCLSKSVCESVLECVPGVCVFLYLCVRALLNWINSAGSSLVVEKSLPAVTSVLQFLTHSHTVDHHQMQSDGESDERMEGGERVMLRRNDERIALNYGAPGRGRESK